MRNEAIILLFFEKFKSFLALFIKSVEFVNSQGYYLNYLTLSLPLLEREIDPFVKNLRMEKIYWKN